MPVRLIREAGGWPEEDGLPFDNGAQVSLGNRRDLTQDAELPAFFSRAFALLFPLP